MHLSLSYLKTTSEYLNRNPSFQMITYYAGLNINKGPVHMVPQFELWTPKKNETGTGGGACIHVYRPYKKLSRPLAKIVSVKSCSIVIQCT